MKKLLFSIGVMVFLWIGFSYLSSRKPQEAINYSNPVYLPNSNILVSCQVDSDCEVKQIDTGCCHDIFSINKNNSPLAWLRYTQRDEWKIKRKEKLKSFCLVAQCNNSSNPNDDYDSVCEWNVCTKRSKK